MISKFGRLTLLAFTTIGLIAGGPAARSVSQQHLDQVRVASSEEMVRRNSNAFALILGEFRASISDFMFIKTERYLDSGVAYEPHIHLEKAPAENLGLDEEHKEHVHTDECKHGDHHVNTIILTEEKDFRGFLGNLERTVKPYRDPRLPHNHTSGEELLPWYRLMTLANPRQIRPYLIGAMWLATEREIPKAIDFLTEGIRNNQDNPDLFRLYASLATIHVKKRYASKTDTSWIAPALEAARKAFEFGHQQWKMRNGDESKWRTDQDEDLQMAGFYVALLERERGNADASLKAAFALQEVAPEFNPNNELIQSLQETGLPGTGR